MTADNALHQKIVAHLNANPRNEIMLSGNQTVFVKAETLVSITSETVPYMEGIDAVRINGKRYFPADVRYWDVS